MEFEYPFKKIIQRLVEQSFPEYSKIEKYINFEKLESEVAWLTKFLWDDDYLTFKNSNKNILAPYEAYIHKLNGADGLENFYVQNPLLTDIINEKIQQELNFIDFIVEKVNDDLNSISNLLGTCATQLKIMFIETGKGDPHNLGKSTTIIEFKNNQKVVFKPRSGKIDGAFNRLLDRVNQTLDSSLKIPGLIDKGSYCYVEFVEHSGVQDLSDIYNYYIEAGILTGLIYCLKGFDFHFENLIACGSHPVLIDLECLMDSSKEHYSVLDTNLIPQCFFLDSRNHKFPFDLSGIGSIDDSFSPPIYWHWKNVKSDNMQLVRRSVLIAGQKNIPHFQDTKITAEKYLESFLSGFRKSCTWIINCNQNDRIINEIFEEFRNVEVRILPRITQEYKNLLENSFVPQAFRSNYTRKNIIYEDLKVFPINISLENNQKELLFSAECKSIIKQNIPHFTINSNENCIRESGVIVIENYKLDSPYDKMIAHVKKMNFAKLEKEVSKIENSFASRFGNKLKVKREEVPVKVDIAQELENIVIQIVNQLCKDMKGDGYRVFHPLGSGTYASERMDISLYNGKLGIVVFLKAYQNQGNNLRFKNEITHLINELIEDSVLNIHEIGKEEILSIASGLSGIIYSLCTIDNEMYYDLCFKMSSLIFDELIQETTNFDLMDGLSGCMLALLKLYESRKDQSVLNKCISIATKLLDMRTFNADSTFLVFKDKNADASLGVAHGQSGVALSLLRLYNITENAIYLEAAENLISFEDSYFSDDRLNWLDIRYSEEIYQNAWCYGAAGMGLVRIELFKIIGDQQFLEVAKLLVENPNLYLSNSVDTYCCGILAMVDFLIELYNVTGLDVYMKSANEITHQILKEKNARGFYQTYENESISEENLSLFRGLSGLGYVNMRLSDPDLNSMGLFS
ncbi:MAG: type 2 lanthipeptide synthetase LanM family protein [Nonlabens sp.]